MNAISMSPRSHDRRFFCLGERGRAAAPPSETDWVNVLFPKLRNGGRVHQQLLGLGHVTVGREVRQRNVVIGDE